MLHFLPLFSILSLYFDKVKRKFAFPIFLFIKFLFPRSCPFVQIAAGRQLFPTERGARRPASSENLTGFYLFFRRFPIDKRRCIGYPVSSEIEYRHTMKGICLFCLHPRERLSGAKPYGASWRLTPECELFEWALLDANKSGTAENLCLRLFDRKRGGAFFILSAYLGKDRVSHEKL